MRQAQASLAQECPRCMTKRSDHKFVLIKQSQARDSWNPYRCLRVVGLTESTASLSSNCWNEFSLERKLESSHSSMLPAGEISNYLMPRKNFTDEYMLYINSVLDNKDNNNNNLIIIWARKQKKFWIKVSGQSWEWILQISRWTLIWKQKFGQMQCTL